MFTERLIEALKKLTDNQIRILAELAEKLGNTIEKPNKIDSDFVTQEFWEDFSARLLAYHAFHEERLTKKSFEYIVLASSNSTGKRAELITNPNHPGQDIIINNVAFSLKTEGSKSIKKDELTISKLMEARWIRDCKTKRQLVKGIQDHIMSHLSSYERIFCLRSFNRDDYLEYELVEIPLDLLKLVSQIKSSNLGPLTKNGGCSANVIHQGKKAFTLRLDGSVEKVTIANLMIENCIRHAVWKIPKNAI
ncbi:hypothetical protein AY600_09650 [Phormidium willei BDU 130791]|nr:hypothetical protein AY600_09650 [Phormidium willei BDU 130791]